jgi:hypothetical protein
MVLMFEFYLRRNKLRRDQYGCTAVLGASRIGAPPRGRAVSG